jgi:predicted flavoprotein YhiN
MKEAQCAAGGIPVCEIRKETMESALAEGLYLCGEMLDIDGICGGYNLSFAFLTGMRAGRSAADD